VTYTAEEARRQLLDDLADGTDQLALALACIGEAYDEVDERTADVLEEQIFKPLQAAYGRARRTHSEFAGRYGLPLRTFEPRSPGTHSNDPRVYLERAAEAVEQADHRIAELQDSMMPVEVGDTELRAGLSDTRSLIAELPARGRRVLRALGR
jgi:hypothetical protein